MFLASHSPPSARQAYLAGVAVSVGRAGSLKRLQSPPEGSGDRRRPTSIRGPVSGGLYRASGQSRGAAASGTAAATCR